MITFETVLEAYRTAPEKEKAERLEELKDFPKTGDQEKIVSELLFNDLGSKTERMNRRIQWINVKQER